MKRFLLTLLAFFLFALAAYLPLVWLWGDLFPDAFHRNLVYRLGYTGFLHTRAREVPKYPNADVLFLGSSHAYRGFDTRIFQRHGIRAFNMGSSAQSPEQTEVLFRRYVDELRPRLVVYEVYPARFELDGVESGLDVTANDRVDLGTASMALRVNHIKVYNCLAYAGYRQLFGLDRDYREPARRGPDTYVSGGYVEQKISYFRPEAEYKPARWEMRPDQKRAFERTLALAREKRIPVVLVQCPIVKVKYASYTNHAEVAGYFRSQGLPYVNFNGQVPLTDTLHFLDHAHLNQQGVDIFNPILIERLELKKRLGRE